MVNRGVQHNVTCLNHDPTNNAGLNISSEIHRPPSLLSNSITNLFDGSLIKRHCRSYTHRKSLIEVLPKRVIAPTRTEKHRHSVLFKQQLEKIHQNRICTQNRTLQSTL